MADDAAESLALFKRLTESLTSVQEKNDRLLEAVEIAESKSATGSASEVPLLKNLRARLSAVHAPNAALVRDLKRAGELFESKATSFQASKKRYDELYDQLEVEKLDVKHRASQLDQEVKFFEKEKSEWKEKLEAAKAEISEQNERLSLLSDRLAGTKTALESRENDLTNQRVLFEEERLVTRLEGPSSLEMDELKAQIKAQISRAMEAENARMKAELTLHQMREEMKQLNKVNERLRRETCQSRQTSTKTLQQFEKRTIEGSCRD
jgi:chromosome segregation ATPase